MYTRIYATFQCVPISGMCDRHRLNAFGGTVYGIWYTTCYIYTIKKLYKKSE